MFKLGNTLYLVHANKAYSQFNSRLSVARKQNLGGIYDPHTNIMQYPAIMQPTHARWERVPPPSEDVPNGVNGHKAITDEDTVMQMDATPETIFPPVKPIYSRNYLITDTIYETPPSSTMGIPGPDGDTYDIGFNGLSNVPDDILDELPPDCRKAFEEARAKELKWKSGWSTEALDTERRMPSIDKIAIA